MIREACSCGATFMVDWEKQPYEPDAVAVWRENHKHESQTVAREDPKVQPVTEEEIKEAMGWDSIPQTFVKASTLSPMGMDAFTINEDYILGEYDQPVWISQTRTPPPHWKQWAEHWTPSRPMDMFPAAPPEKEFPEVQVPIS